MISPARSSSSIVAGNETSTARVGVLALQGSVEPHRRALERLGEPVAEVRRAPDLDGLTHLVIPGGESTTLYKLLDFYEMWGPIGDLIRTGRLAAFGTCAGAILLGRGEEYPPRWELIDVEVRRNAYGRQIDSFIAPLEPEPNGPLVGASLEGVFIRAPRFGEIGPDVEVIARREGEPVLACFRNILVSACHPELTSDPAVHRFFLSSVGQRDSRAPTET